MATLSQIFGAAGGPSEAWGKQDQAKEWRERLGLSPDVIPGNVSTP